MVDQRHWPKLEAEAWKKSKMKGPFKNKLTIMFPFYLTPNRLADTMLTKLKHRRTLSLRNISSTYILHLKLVGQKCHM